LADISEPQVTHFKIKTEAQIQSSICLFRFQEGNKLL